MTKAEAEWLKTLSSVADECGLDYEDIAPEHVVNQGWDEARACHSYRNFSEQCTCSADSHIHMLVKSFDLGLTPNDVQTLAIKKGIWTK